MEQEQFDLECIGFKEAFTGDKMYHYKLKRDDKEYLIVDANMIRLLNMIWSEENTFDNTKDLWDDFARPITNTEKELEKAVKLCKKKDYELKEDEEHTFFTQHTIVPKQEPVKPKRKHGHLVGNEVNSLMRIINDNAPFLEEHKFFTLTKEMIEDEEGEFEELAGYKVKYTTDGSHKNDGQMVEYTFTLKSPTGKITSFSSEMCLMVGWNYHENLIID